MFTHRIGGGGAVLRQQRVGNAVGEAAVRFVADADELERQVRGQQVDDRARAAVTGIHHQLQRLEPAGIDIAEQVLDVGALVVLGNLPGTRRLGLGRIGGNRVGDCEQAGIGADRPGILLDQLHAVVIHRVVAGGDHHAAGRAQMVGLEIDFFRAAQADVDHLAPGTTQAGGQCILQRRAGQAHIVAEDHWTGSELRGQGDADAAGQVFVQFFRHTAADIVGLEGGQGHRSVPL